jgi:hypothetical protein
VVRSDASTQGWSSTVSFVEFGGAETTISQTKQQTIRPQSMSSQLLELVEEGAIISFTSYADDDVITIQQPVTNEVVFFGFVFVRLRFRVPPRFIFGEHLVEPRLRDSSFQPALNLMRSLSGGSERVCM